MDSFITQRRKDTPLILLDTTTNTFLIEGESYIEHPNEFYRPMLDWVKDYLEVNQYPLTVNFRLDYFNTPSSLAFFDLLVLIESFYLQKKVPVTINWFVERGDVEMTEDGETYKADFPRLPFQVVLKKLAA